MSGLQLGRIRTDEGARWALYVPKRSLIHAAWIESNGVHVHRLPIETDIDQLPQTSRNTVRRARRRMLDAGKRLGITKSARRFLNDN